MNNSDNQCKLLWYWLVQICHWGAMVFLMISLVSMSDSTIAVFTFCVTWLIYFLSALCCATCSYLANMTKNSTIHEYMLNLFKERPNLSFSVKCYHYETRQKKIKDKDGYTSYQTEQVKVFTHSETRDFHYMSSRDVSGLFRLDSQFVIETPNKHFVKLNLKLNVRKSEDGTKENYLHQRDSFYNSNRWRDHSMDTTESTSLNGFNEYNLVSIGNEMPSLVNLGFYLLFALLGFVEFYKIYVDSFCIEQQYTIIKEISSFRNLNAHLFQSNYAQFNPSIIFNSHVLLNFDDPSQLPINNLSYSDLPTVNEIDQNNIYITNRNSSRPLKPLEDTLDRKNLKKLE